MSTELDRAADTLFPSAGHAARNVKFFRGRNRAVTAEQMAEQFNRAEAQVRNRETAPVEDIDD